MIKHTPRIHEYIELRRKRINIDDLCIEEIELLNNFRACTQDRKETLLHMSYDAKEASLKEGETPPTL